MPLIEISVYILALIGVLPAIIMFLIHKGITNKLQNNFLDIEKENLSLNATILDLEKQIVDSKSSALETKENAGIVRMTEKKSTKIV
jgi:hypothetical protein